MRSEATLYCRSGQCEESRFSGVKLQCSNEILRSLRSLRMTFRATAVVVLGYYRFGMRYGLPLLPFLLLFIAATIWELARRWQLGASVVAGLVVATFLAFWPNMRLLPNPWLNLPREELRPVVAYVHQQAQPGDFIYVYYGAVPAYQVYQPELTYPTELGTWFRDWPLVEKISEIRRAVGDAPRFWLVMSHIHPSEDSALIDGLTEATPSYHLVDEYRTKNAATVLLQRDEL